MANYIVIPITGDDKSIRKILADLEKDSKKSGDKVAENTEKASTSAFSQIAGSVGKLGAAVAAVKATYESLRFALNAPLMAEEIRAVNKQFEMLTSQAGLATDALKNGLVKAASGLVDTEDLLQAANKAVVTLGDSADRLPQLMELARKATSVFGGELLQNFEGINQAIASGSTKALKQLGIIIDSEKAYRDYAQSIGTSEKFLNAAGKQQALLNAVLEQGNKAFAGVDENMRKNEMGSQRLKVALGQLGDAAAITFDKLFGSAVSNATNKLTGSLTHLTNFLMSKFGSESEKAGSRVAYLTKELERYERIAKEAGQFSPGEKFFAETRIKKLTEELKKLNAEEERGAMLAMKRGQAESMNKGGGAASAGAPSNVIDLEKVREERAKFQQEMVKANDERLNLEAANATTLEEFNRINNERKLQVESEYQTRHAEMKKQFLDTGVATKAQFNALEEQMTLQKNAKIAALEKAANANLEAMRKMAQSGILNGLVSAFSALGGALARGQNGFEAFGKAVISAMGAIAIQMGALLVQIGLGFSALGPIMPVWGLSGAAAVAAGLGLIALGGALQAAGGGGGDSGGGAVGSGGGTGGGVATTPSETTSLDPSDVGRQPRTQITVQIQGNVLDRRQTGLEIAEVIQETFGSNGLEFKTA